MCYVQKLRLNEEQTNDEKNRDGGGSFMAVCGESPRASKIIVRDQAKGKTPLILPIIGPSYFEGK